MKYWVIALSLFMAGCGIPQTHLTSVTETPIPFTSTPQLIEVTRIVRVEETMIVTATPNPPLAQECLSTAVTQLELNGCAALEAQLAKEDMERIISQIEFSSEEEEQEFNRLQTDWETQIAKNCEFLFAQIITDDQRNLFYKGGSMAPMQRNFCIAEQYKRHTEDLKFAYFAR